MVHPDALAGSSYGGGRSQAENVAAVAEDVLGHGNSVDPNASAANIQNKNSRGDPGSGGESASGGDARSPAVCKGSSGSRGTGREGGGMARLPGAGAHSSSQRSTQAGGVLLSRTEVDALKSIHADLLLLLHGQKQHPQGMGQQPHLAPFPDTPRWFGDLT